ncbi:MAG: PAC2 family protein [Methanothrix sp.]|uniref:PAC2 family protein n=1 Tax=Methanothrix sp. TaxID=90426 RepID=UPI0025ECC7FA|nr:PAC2 family protein [Methanothrix sp.]MCQ8902593.1 PAC2 family protein [Methanothrix sp.]
MLFERKVAVVSFPGIGSVGKVAVDYLISYMNSRMIMTLPFSGFPPQVLIQEGIARLFTLDVFSPEGRDDIILLTSDAQPLEVLGMNRLAGEILSEMRAMGVRDVVTLAAYVGAVHENVVGTSTEAAGVELLKNAGISVMPSSIIGGMNGIIAGMAPLYGLRGFCILGTTSGDRLVDLNAARSLLLSLKNLLKMEIDVSQLEIEEEEEAEEIEAPEVEEYEDDMLYR